MVLPIIMVILQSNFPDLKTSLNIYGNEIPTWKIAQHLSSLIGALFIVLAYLRLPQKNIIKYSISKKYWLSVFTLTLLILFIRFSISFNTKAFGNIIVSVIAAFLISLILSPRVLKLNQFKNK